MRNIMILIASLISKILLLLPLSNIIIFESNPDFNDEGYWMCKLMIEKGYQNKYKFVWLTKDKNCKTPDGWSITKYYKDTRKPIEWLRKQHARYTAKYIFDSCDFVYKKRKGQCRIFLMHGMPLKNCDKYLSKLGEVDLISIGSTYFLDYYRKFNISREKILTLGLVRNDALAESKLNIREVLQLQKDSKVIIWMPTYRQHVDGNNVGCSVPINCNDETGFPVLRFINDFSVINEKLKETNTVLVIKPHQSQNLQNILLKNYSNISFITTDQLTSKEIQLYSLLHNTDALLTDYSSIYVDYLLLDKPIGLVMDDFEVYKEKVGFPMQDFKADIEGTYIEDRNDFMEFIDKLSNNYDELKKDLGGAKERFHTVMDYTSGKKILDQIVKRNKI